MTTQITVSNQTSHNTAQTELIEAAGVEFAYRRFGRPAGLPLVMLQHFRGNPDNWDPALTDALASERDVILVELMAGLIPDAQIRIYPDAAHGFLFQYLTEVADEVNTFLAR
jgi:pimeloyl-ACP methyl ester carboxylesterase